MKYILVTGSNGQVGKAIQNIASNYNFNFIFTDRASLDISNKEQVNRFFNNNTIDYLINCAAYTQVDKAEEEKAKAKAINEDALLYLSEACAEANIPLIHLSSDYVYHPDHNNEMEESEPTCPQGIYAKTKLNGDLIALENHNKSIILRTSWVYAQEGKNFVNTIARLSAERDSLKVVNDQIGSPTYAPDIAATIMQIIEHIESGNDAEKYHGLYHFSNAGFISWYEFAKKIVQLSHNKCVINSCPSSEYPTPAKRPHNSRLSKTKIENTFGIAIKPWQESLRNCLTK